MVIIFTDHAELNHLLKKSNSKPGLIHWVLLLQEFGIEIRGKADDENVIADHLCCLGAEANPIEELSIDESFPDDQHLVISHQAMPWCADLVNFKVYRVMPSGLSYQQQKRFLSNEKYFIWEPLLYKPCGDGVYRRCLPEDEVRSVLHYCHTSTYGGHFGPDKTIAKVFQANFY